MLCSVLYRVIIQSIDVLIFSDMLKDTRFIDLIKEGADGISDLSSGEETVHPRSHPLLTEF